MPDFKYGKLHEDAKSSTILCPRSTVEFEQYLTRTEKKAKASITFNFTNITPKDSQDIKFEGDAAYSSNDGIQNNSLITSGGAIGLPFNYSQSSSSIHPFVAVEFDTFGSNSRDPVDPVTNFSIGDHVGININSMASVMYRKWFSNITHGKECNALIKYSSDSKNLSVSFTNLVNNSLVWETGLDYTIDLRDELPEWVIFGFSASTGINYEKNNVRSWVFNSSEFKVDQSSSLPPITSPNTMKERNKTALMVGLSVGTSVLLTVLAVLAYVLWRRKKNNDAADPSLGSNFAQVEMTCLMIVGLWCAHPDSKLRPSMKQAIQVLNSEVSLPLLPSNMPYVSYSALPHFSFYGQTLSSGSNKRSSNDTTSSTVTS
ncbi:hypothetical protein L1987_55167 [Smallanthus sonchifolius]|uniref:Uncharacterized protein n=1 Tax=Smallanthus sonchifolius TaxID=185202 RepID=A0ACB9E932_9ASTR|nr:hypothetical protein L1987_55167 [Smallanthus sonchifolius]